MSRICDASAGDRLTLLQGPEGTAPASDLQPATAALLLKHKPAVLAALEREQA